MNFFWPINAKLNPGLVCRFGRVLHWGLTIVAVGVAVGGWFVFYEQDRLWATLIGGGVFFLAGRAARYVFSGE